MIVVIQRTNQASVTISEKVISSIGVGMLVLLGIEETDNSNDVEWLTKKIASLRIFPDENDVMNKSLLEVNGEALVVSQFTLYASTKKGNRPSYIKAARPEVAIPLYQKFIDQLSMLLGQQVKTGEFGADMQVALVNDGPVTILIDTKDKK